LTNRSGAHNRAGTVEPQRREKHDALHLARIFDDEDHSIEEQREIIIGHSVKGWLLVVCFAAQGNSVRIFSARKATMKERKDYKENVKS